MKLRASLTRVVFALSGAAALLWVLARVIPKPSRAAYPCMKAAAPLAGGFVGWMIAILSTLAGFRFARINARGSRYIIAAVCILSGLLGAVFTLGFCDKPAHAGTLAANSPVGIAKGVCPGRVIWVHDTNATHWQGPGDGYWWESTHTIQSVVDSMLCKTLRQLSGAETDSAAWDLLFRYFNRSRTGADSSYRAGEKIMIKPNFVGFTIMPGWGGVDPVTYDLTSFQNYMNTSPQVILALLRQLVNVLHVNPSDITLGDPTTLFPNQFYDYFHNEFPSIHYLDNQGKFGRLKALPSTVPVYWSCRPEGVTQDYVPESYAEAAYLINVSNFKSHTVAGITLGAKNHFGSLIRLPVDSGYYNLHNSLAFYNPADSQYRVLVDLLGHAHLGGKTVLSLVDGLYSGIHDYNGLPRKWNFGPFKNDWTSSLFASQDPVALECVLFDLMQQEGTTQAYPKMAGVSDYLQEAALADNPPSGTFYDPDHPVATQRLPSLGVCEHWNNPVEMKYSRNLGTGAGIELVFIDSLDDRIEQKDESKTAGTCTRPLLFVQTPFPAYGRITANMSQSASVSVTLHNVAGKNILTLFSGDCAAGSNSFTWNGRNNSGQKMPAGYYFLRLNYRNQKAKGVETAKLMLVY